MGTGLSPGLSAWVSVSHATNRLLEPCGRRRSVYAWVLVIAMLKIVKKPGTRAPA
jgi:hypothetical protein